MRDTVIGACLTRCKETNGTLRVGDVHQIEIDLVARPVEQGHALFCDDWHECRALHFPFARRFGRGGRTIVDWQERKEPALRPGRALDQIDRRRQLSCPGSNGTLQSVAAVRFGGEVQAERPEVDIQRLDGEDDVLVARVGTESPERRDRPPLGSQSGQGCGSRSGWYAQD